jgi:putative transposase
MTSPRIVVAGATVAITRRTTLRKAFLAPWHPGVAQASLYALADAQRHTGMAIHHFIDVITHHHVSGTDTRANLPEFIGRYHHTKSCALNTLLARERYDQPGELFDDRSTHVMRLLDAPAQSTQHIYEHLNCVAAGLVDRPEHMPGYVFDFGLWKAGYIEVRRPDFYFSKDRPEVMRLEITPPPLLYQAFDGDTDALVHHMQRMANVALRELRAHQGRAPLGARRIERLHPWSEPRTLRESRGRLLPSFRIGARGIVGRQMHIEAAQETTAFRHSHHDARQAWAIGDRNVVFPFGTYQMRVQHSALVSQSAEAGGGLVCRPGPLLCDVQAELDAARDRRRAFGLASDSEGRFALVNQTCDAFRQEAAELCEHAAEGMDFHSPPAHVAAATASVAEHENEDDASAQRTPAVVRHRFARTRPGQDRGARRVVTLRDRRRGRRSLRHGNDPPV